MTCVQLGACINGKSVQITFHGIADALCTDCEGFNDNPYISSAITPTGTCEFTKTIVDPTFCTTNTNVKAQAVWAAADPNDVVGATNGLSAVFQPILFGIVQTATFATAHNTTETYRQLWTRFCAGEIVRMDFTSNAFGTYCDSTAAYADVKLV
jgi:hypothetical protein